MAETMTELGVVALAQALTEVPTAPFREQWVMARLDELLDRIPGLERVTDRFGNRIVRLRRGPVSSPPAVFVAHLDHPGFLFPAPLPAGQADLVYTGLFEGRVSHCRHE